MSQRLFLCLFLLTLIVPGLADPPDLDRIAFDQRLDQTVPLNLSFQDDQGQAVSLGQYFSTSPAILLFAYYRCPNLCSITLQGLADSLQRIPFKAGQAFQVVVVGIDPRETPQAAASKKVELIGHYPKAALENWHLLTGEAAIIQQLADSVGYRYRYDASLDQYAHAAGIVLLTPGGRIARYFYGVQFPSEVLRLSLVEATKGRIGSPIDQLLLLCYDYNPETGRYTVVIMKVLRLAGLVTVALMGSVIAWLMLRERGKPTVSNSIATDGTD
ncbi:MAG TPA: SCO family protein [Candidatus Competibacteraceae bacterium]|nr:SCO family protein [Candidatus Competibacteraceae bacterium]